MGSGSKTVCVTEASDFIGSWLVKRLIEKGYTVRATVRDPANMRKVKHLLELPGANTNLTLWKADLAEEGSFDKAIKGCTGVFHAANPDCEILKSKDPENEVIKPAISGLLNIMNACLRAKTVRRVIFTSSAGPVKVSRDRNSLLNEACSTDVEFCKSAQMTGWMYFVSTTLSEQEASEFAKKHKMDFITIIPPLVVGSFLMPSIPPRLLPALSPITGNDAYYWIIKQGQFVHLDDLCRAHIFLFEEPKAEGRYICSACDATTHQIANLINERYPNYRVSTEFRNIPDKLKLARFSSNKLTDLGFQFKYSLEDMYIGAIETCRKKELLPKPAVPDALAQTSRAS